RGFVAVIAEEQLFEAGLLAHEVEHSAAGDRSQQRLESTAHVTAETRSIDAHLGHAFGSLDGVERRSAGEFDLDMVDPQMMELVESGDADEAAAADDPDVIADVFHLREHMGREKDGRAVLARLRKQVIKRLLVERIEAGGWFVEDQ